MVVVWFGNKVTLVRQGHIGSTRHRGVPGFLFLMALMNRPLARILVNDRERSVPEGTSVTALLGELGLQPKFLAVELNRRVVPRAEHPTTILADGDRVEVVTLVGGG